MSKGNDFIKDNSFESWVLPKFIFPILENRGWKLNQIIDGEFPYYDCIFLSPEGVQKTIEFKSDYAGLDTGNAAWAEVGNKWGKRKGIEESSADLFCLVNHLVDKEYQKAIVKVYLISKDKLKRWALDNPYVNKFFKSATEDTSAFYCYSHKEIEYKFENSYYPNDYCLVEILPEFLSKKELKEIKQIENWGVGVSLSEEEENKREGERKSNV